MTEIPVEDAKLYADPDQDGATRYVCKSRTACHARVKAATEHAERMRQEAEARQQEAREALIAEAKRRLSEDAAKDGDA